jgi:hypothetical protein
MPLDCNNHVQIKHRTYLTQFKLKFFRLNVMILRVKFVIVQFYSQYRMWYLEANIDKELCEEMDIISQCQETMTTKLIIITSNHCFAD